MDWFYESYIDEAKWQPTTIWELSVVSQAKTTDFLSDLNTTPLRIHAYIFKEWRGKSPIAHVFKHTHTAHKYNRSILILLRTKTSTFLKLTFSPGFIKEDTFHRTSLKKKNYNRKSSESQQEKWVYTTHLLILSCVTQNNLKNLSERQFSLTK